MKDNHAPFSFFGIGLGALALLLAMLHFWMGPFKITPPSEQTLAEKAVAIKKAAVAALKGETLAVKSAPAHNIDRNRRIHRVQRAAAGSAILGGAAIAFQFAIMAIGAIIVVGIIIAIVAAMGGA